MRSALDPDCYSGYMGLQIRHSQKTLLKWMTFTVYKFYLNKLDYFLKSQGYVNIIRHLRNPAIRKTKSLKTIH